MAPLNQTVLEPGEWMRVRNRRYRILERLTASGAGVQRYKAVDPEARPGGEECALHVLPANRQTGSCVRVLKRVSDRNRSFLPILAYNPWQDATGASKVVLVLPWLPGRTLRDYLNAAKAGHGPGISPFEAFRLFRGLAHGVSNLNHRSNIVHGDIKPENLIVTREPTQLVLIDFGSAWLVEEAATHMALDGVTRAYAAPERIRGTPVPDFRSDQFSVSAIFYEMLTLGRPYGGLGGAAFDDGNEGFREFTPPSTQCRERGKLADSAWKRVDTVICRGLAPDREDRYPNRRDWLDAVDAIDFEIKRTSRMGSGEQAIASLIERADRWRAAAWRLVRRIAGPRDSE